MSSLKFSSCGTKSHMKFEYAGHVANRSASDQMECGSSRVDWMYSRSTGSHQMQVSLIRSYKGCDLIARDASEVSDRDLTTMLKGVFITLITRLHLDPPSRSVGGDIIETVHDGPFHRNRRSF